MRLESARERGLKFLDDNLEDFAKEEILIPTQQLAWQEGLTEHAIGTIEIEHTGYLQIKLVWNLFGPNDEPLSIWLEDGTIEHDIEAKGKASGGADSLMWYSKDGKPIFRKKVHHPGTTGKKIIERGWNITQERFKKRLMGEMNNYLEVTKIG